MHVPEPRRPALLIFGSLIIFALFVAFACGHLTGRLASVPTPTFDASHTDKLAAVSEILVDICHGVRRQEYLDLEDALRRQKEYAPAEHAPVIDECLRVLRESWKERAEQEPTSLYRAD